MSNQKLGTSATPNGVMWLLVRSNPAKKDSIHYTLRDAQMVQLGLSRPTTNRGPEKTEIHEITVDRELCAVAFIQTSFATSLEPNNGND